ncbi:hypothetical protein [Microcoleus asticus]|nr:hypothetical protein [Microcoleus asticus]
MSVTPKVFKQAIEHGLTNWWKDKPVAWSIFLAEILFDMLVKC